MVTALGRHTRFPGAPNRHQALDRPKVDRRVGRQLRRDERANLLGAERRDVVAAAARFGANERILG